MLTLRPAAERGQARFGWLDSRHTFSFGHYYDPDHTGFGALRVLNEDRVQPAAGFDTHRHHDMEIVTVVLEGALEHRDSLGNGAVLRAGEVQRMTAGTGIQHSEYNHSPSLPVHFLQIWIEPRCRGLEPGYEQKPFPPGERRGHLRPLVTPDGRDGSLTLHQDAEIHGAVLAPGERVDHRLRPGRRAWLQVSRGRVLLDTMPLAAGDGVAVQDEPGVRVEGVEDAELLLFDLA